MRNSKEIMGDDYFDWVEWTGYSPGHLPLAIRDADDSRFYISSLSAQLGDSTCDPRSGGIAGTKNLAMRYGVSVQQFRRNILPTLTYVHKYYGILISHVSSVDHDAQKYKSRVRKQWCDNLNVWTDCSSGYL